MHSHALFSPSSGISSPLAAVCSILLLLSPAAAVTHSNLCHFDELLLTEAIPLIHIAIIILSPGL